MRDKFIPRDLETKIFERLNQIMDTLDELAGQQVVKDFYSVEEFAKIVDRDPFTVREWCRLGRIGAAKKLHGRGGSHEWAISHKEKCRYDAEGLLPRQQKNGEKGGDAR
jgi:hypothetical protein